MTDDREQRLKELQDRLHYSFHDVALLEQALTHRSFAHEKPELVENNNERMEFLGDAILGFFISDFLVRTYEQFDEGQLSRIRASLVNERTLSAVAEAIPLGDYVRLGRGEASSGGRAKTSILSDTLEAVVAAVYLDGGFPRFREWFQSFFIPLLESKRDHFSRMDYKTALQQVTQKKYRNIPAYELIGESGPDHCKRFTVRMTVGGLSTEGSGRTKKEAEQEAARKALEQIEVDTEENLQQGSF